MQDLSSWTPIQVAAHWVRLWMLVFLPLSSYESPSNHSCHGQVVTLLYIGGASSTSGLLSCQETDGAGETWQHFLWGGGASQIEWGTFTKSQQEFKVSMCVAMSETWWKEAGAISFDPISLSLFFLHLTFSAGVESKISWDIWRPLLLRLRTYFPRDLCIANWCPTFSATRSLKHG